MRKLFIYMKGLMREVVLAPLFKMLEASFELIVPLVVAAIIDRGIGQGDGAYIWKMSLCLVLLALVSKLFPR